MIKITPESEHNVLGRGIIYIINLEDYNIDLTPKAVRENLINKKVEINGVVRMVIGVESFQTFENTLSKHVGLITK